MLEEDNSTTYTVSVCYKDERDSETIEQVSKSIAKTIAQTLQAQIEAKKEYGIIEVDEKGFYIFRMFEIKNIHSIEVDEEWSKWKNMQ